MSLYKWRPVTRAILKSPLIVRSFQSTSKKTAENVPLVPARTPVGAFRGGIFGFLLGSTLTGFSVYYYILEEYRVSNELLSSDIYSLQASVQRVYKHVQTLEQKVYELQKRK